MSFLTLFRKPSLESLLDTLGADAANPPAATPPAPDRFVFDVTHRVQIWYDTANAVQSQFGTLTAYRAITLRGELLWFVHEHGRGDRFHAVTDTALDAMCMANAAWDQAQRACAMAVQLTRLTQDIRRGRVRFHATLEDAQHTPMSPLGFRAVLDGAGLFGVSRISASTLVRMMRREPQLTYVLHAAWERHKSAPSDDQRPVRRPTGFAAIC
ncbi:MAG: hypothetical protein AAFP16_00965 [Pseudomonadota bacterium]